MTDDKLLQEGLDILRREARGCRSRSWKRHNELMRIAADHVWACGGDWLRIGPEFSKELAALMRL